jgi:hypothetical protein
MEIDSNCNLEDNCNLALDTMKTNMNFDNEARAVACSCFGKVQLAAHEKPMTMMKTMDLRFVFDLRDRLASKHC